ncbi:pentapeptide repeat-containing protein [Desulfopila sp. IMCC35006]|uniref:pentapeptide repeat-containing protein n=1 Tax=Desulfopila sp. IMCC35006 TaxID=2569542 RepID=UPI0010AD1881|nr:pentapeptide repeat-containing protein [Desulfopila sp. IMCC35006]TKB25881.1 pentapeptide repeat-containing protein [Desulfopila sp. IMCC35006]
MIKRIAIIFFSITGLPLLALGKSVPTPAVTVIDSPWVYEEEFLTHPTLHARNNQTVILNLESSVQKGRKNLEERAFRGESKDRADRGKRNIVKGNKSSHKDRGKSHQKKDSLIKNSVRFLVEEEQRYSFCIPDEEPYIVRIKLTGSSRNTMLNTRKGSACKAVLLEPGRYALDIYHDGSRVGAGKKAFLHRPARQRHLRSQSPVGTTHGGTLQEQLTYPNFFALSAGTNSIGKMYLHSDTNTDPPKLALSASSNGVIDKFVLSFYNATTDFQQFQNSRPLAPWLPQSEWDSGFAPVTITPFVNSTFQYAPYTMSLHAQYCPTKVDNSTFFCTVGFILNDAGDGTYTMWADTDVDNLFPWVEAQPGGPDNHVPVVVSSVSGNVDDPNALNWDFTFIGYADASTMPPLQEGEFAIYSQCDFKGTAFVFDSDVDFSEFSTMTQAAITPPSSIKTIKLGPSTFLQMFKNGQSVANIGADVSCASEPIVADQTNVFIDVLKFIAATNSCINCNLAGVDFSGDDFSGADFGDGTKGVDFSGAILTGANLANANFSNTNLTDADLDTITGTTVSSMSGASFTGASLDCTSFKGSDLTGAGFGNNTFMADQRCYVDLSGATFDFATFDKTVWRYLDLSSSTAENVPDVISTAAEPLDLSGAVLTNVKWLKGKTLDYVNLGCNRSDAQTTTVCPASSGTEVCTTLQGAELTGASLIKACLSGASMEGVDLAFSNLDGTDLSNAVLEANTGGTGSGRVGTLEGAFMRDVDMSGANLTGVNASNVNFYSSSSTPTAIANEITAPGADFSGAYMAGADFSGSTSNLQSTNWSGAMLINANFSQADLSVNTSGGVNSGTNSTFKGAYLQGAIFDEANISDVDFTSTYWDAQGSGGKFNFLIPRQNLGFTGYWKGPDVPECPAPELKYPDSILPPSATNEDNTCPDGGTGPCDTVWDQPRDDISDAFFQSSTTGFPQVGGLNPADQCGGTSNPADFCWNVTNNPVQCPENQ